MEPVGSTYAALPAADFSTTRSTGGLRSASGSADPTASKNGSGQIAPEKRQLQQGVQLSAQQADEFAPYTQRGEQNNREIRSGERPQGGVSPAKNSQENQDPQVRAEIEQLKASEEKVKAHEAAHKSVGGTMTGPVSYSYTRGPDGKNYISGGEVPITISPGKTPQETISRMQQVIQAALAPSDPSPQDRAVAAQATAQMQEASQKLSESTQKSVPGTPSSASSASQHQSDSINARDAQRAYGNPAVNGKQPTIPAGTEVSSSEYQNNAAQLAGAGRMALPGLTAASITGFGTTHPVSYYA